MYIIFQQTHRLSATGILPQVDQRAAHIEDQLGRLMCAIIKMSRGAPENGAAA